MTKQSRKPGDNVRLAAEMRLWSDVARRSGAIKAHADVIVRQERAKEKDADIVYFGAFMKDAGDVDPMPARRILTGVVPVGTSREAT